MEKRIVRFENEMWWVRADVGEISSSEREKLEEYFVEIKLPYRLADGRLCVAGGVDRDTVFERLEQFYGGWAEVLPF